MMVAHGCPPNHTGDHGHLQNDNWDMTVTCLSASPLTKRDKRKTREMQPNQLHLPPGTTNPLLHTVTA
ncbi:hypothetical protein E2C01_078648 [Portunus trituberculatus]|uniref:Uncharacterized protein n=1 Tax=Portunus trituberculatus TaxID=210409 RepID=A0A5B7INC1_PORTR|nr:hypothetical protein [Portunus trituberculatus]